MGFDIARSAANLGASVILVAGPSSHSKSFFNSSVSCFGTEMYEACHQYFDEMETLPAAAV
jgi:phosphopantothenoylcysteine decarboxylase/phosphopantothenate--cysteine ligase